MFFFQARRPFFFSVIKVYRGADKSLARPGRKQATTTEDFEFDISVTVHHIYK